eukprot:503401-Pelagomonas_calceolata.AAC.2
MQVGGIGTAAEAAADCAAGAPGTLPAAVAALVAVVAGGGYGNGRGEAAAAAAAAADGDLAGCVAAAAAAAAAAAVAPHGHHLPIPLTTREHARCPQGAGNPAKLARTAAGARLRLHANAGRRPAHKFSEPKNNKCFETLCSALVQQADCPLEQGQGCAHHNRIEQVIAHSTCCTGMLDGLCKRMSAPVTGAWEGCGCWAEKVCEIEIVHE